MDKTKYLKESHSQFLLLEFSPLKICAKLALKLKVWQVEGNILVLCLRTLSG